MQTVSPSNNITCIIINICLEHVVDARSEEQISLGFYVLPLYYRHMSAVDNCVVAVDLT